MRRERQPEDRLRRNHRAYLERVRTLEARVAELEEELNATKTTRGDLIARLAAQYARTDPKLQADVAPTNPGRPSYVVSPDREVTITATLTVNPEASSLLSPRGRADLDR